MTLASRASNLSSVHMGSGGANTQGPMHARKELFGLGAIFWTPVLVVPRESVVTVGCDSFLYALCFPSQKSLIYHKSLWPTDVI